jgi:hypothetical protein
VAGDSPQPVSCMSLYRAWMIDKIGTEGEMGTSFQPQAHRMTLSAINLEFECLAVGILPS